jgi:hypothetical protein
MTRLVSWVRRPPWLARLRVVPRAPLCSVGCGFPKVHRGVRRASGWVTGPRAECSGLLKKWLRLHMTVETQWGLFWLTWRSPMSTKLWQASCRPSRPEGSGPQASPPWQLYVEGASTPEDRELHRLQQCHDGEAAPLDDEGRAAGGVRGSSGFGFPAARTSTLRRRPQLGWAGRDEPSRICHSSPNMKLPYTHHRPVKTITRFPWLCRVCGEPPR